MKNETILGLVAAVASLAVSINGFSLAAGQNNDTIKTSDIPSILETNQAAKEALESGNTTMALGVLKIQEAYLRDNGTDIEAEMRTNERCSSADPCTN
jgi:hypothetical protein